MCKLSGLDVKTYEHYKPENGEVDWVSELDAVHSRPLESIFIPQAYCHSPTAAGDLKEQWTLFGKEIKALFPVFDIAHQGWGMGWRTIIYFVCATSLMSSTYKR
ncbi:hypothetical protein DPV78_007514 [Talaromyces pinophilus]|nr:hypothetical protein DPV78_007514 [Talaromyces pinophilus]